MIPFYHLITRVGDLSTYRLDGHAHQGKFIRYQGPEQLTTCRAETDAAAPTPRQASTPPATRPAPSLLTMQVVVCSQCLNQECLCPGSTFDRVVALQQHLPDPVTTNAATACTQCGKRGICNCVPEPLSTFEAVVTLQRQQGMR